MSKRKLYIVNREVDDAIHVATQSTKALGFHYKRPFSNKRISIFRLTFASNFALNAVRELVTQHSQKALGVLGSFIR